MVKSFQGLLMNRTQIIVILAISGFILFSGTIDREEKMEKLKLEIMVVERQFAEMTADKGIKDAFLFYAAEGAVLMRNNKVIKGKINIRKYFDSVKLKNIKLKWKPDFVDISSSGDLAYTYGKYTFSAKDQSGKEINSEGIFHTVWKKQIDGSWKYVWD